MESHIIALECNNCKRKITDRQKIEAILKKYNEFRFKHIMESRKRAVGICPFEGCYGYLFPSA